MLKAILFDMDGVIVDSEPLHKKAYFNMFKDIGIDVSEKLFEFSIIFDFLIILSLLLKTTVSRSKKVTIKPDSIKCLFLCQFSLKI